MQTKLEEQKKDIKKKYKEYRTGEDVNAQVANSIKASAEVEYSKSSVFGWGSLFMVDRLQSKLTGLAITNNTQKLLDAEVLQKTETTPTPAPKG